MVKVNNRQRCRECGRPVKWVSRFKLYVHDVPLARYPVFYHEAKLIHADPPRYKRPLHRPTLLHPAITEDYSVHNPRKRRSHADL